MNHFHYSFLFFFLKRNDTIWNNIFPHTAETSGLTLGIHSSFLFRDFQTARRLVYNISRLYLRRFKIYKNELWIPASIYLHCVYGVNTLTGRPARLREKEEGRGGSETASGKQGEDTHVAARATTSRHTCRRTGAAVAARWRMRGKISGGTRARRVIVSSELSVEWKESRVGDTSPGRSGPPFARIIRSRPPARENPRREDRVTRSASAGDVTARSAPPPPAPRGVAPSLSLPATGVRVGVGAERRVSAARLANANWVACERSARVPRTEGLYGLCSQCVPRRKTSGKSTVRSRNARCDARSR